jgi:hypothetical protein
MEQTLTTEERIAMLTQVKKRKQEEIYTLCVSLGVTYSSFDPATYTLEIPVVNHEYTLLKNAGDAYVNIVAELASLE